MDGNPAQRPFVQLDWRQLLIYGKKQQRQAAFFSGLALLLFLSSQRCVADLGIEHGAAGRADHQEKLCSVG